ncbi:hypothetical protein [Paraburkholderia sp. JPY419]|uniref:hypothetical protein n=1 Tax=Paraburkholderia sp. JPY419 TaxID=667660 RepID=UPI003D263648
MSYPDATWKEAPCAMASVQHPTAKHASPVETMRKKRMSQSEHITDDNADSAEDMAAFTGNGRGYMAQTEGLTTSAIGSFPGTVVSGLVDDAKGYSLQLNTNHPRANASYCAQNGFHPDCEVWQQFVYSSTYPSQPGPQGVTPEGPQIYIQDWILLTNNDDVHRPCPAGWEKAADGCYKNSPTLAAPAIPVGNLGLTTLAGYVSTPGSGATDTVILTYMGSAYTVSQPDDTLDIAQGWSQSEFNIFGNGNASKLSFKPKTSITVNLQVNDGTTYAPKCLYGGTTGETNNLYLGKCTATEGAMPSIQFTESMN